MAARAALLIVVAAGAVFSCTGAGAESAGSTVRIPLTIDYLTLGAALEREMYTEHGRAPLWNGSDQCQYLYAENPRFSRLGGRVSLETDATLALGVAIGSRCLSPITWKGIIEADTVPYIGPHMALKFRVTGLNLYNPQHQKTLIVGKGFDLIKQFFIPRLETFSFDLNPATHQVEDLVAAAAPAEVAERVRATLATLRAEPELLVLDDGVRATLTMTLPVFATPAPAPPSAAAQAVAPLKPAEIAAFEKLLDQWDAFLVFAIKQLGAQSNDPRLRDQLLNLLLDSRYRLVDALAHPESAGPDPVRLLFLSEWQRLGGIIRQAARRGKLGNQSLEFLSFISAGDALFAFDEAAPALGMRISANDLRRLAHIMAPEVRTDPLAFDFKEDSELRKMFGIKQPLELSGPLETTPTEAATPAGTSQATRAATATPSPATSPAPAHPATPNETPTAPRRSPTASPAPTPGAISRLGLRIPLWILESPEVDAAESAGSESAIDAELERIGAKLRRVVVSENNAAQYRARMARLLDLSGERAIDEEAVDSRHRPVYMRLVRTTAWQESCWRQFVVKHNRVVYLESSTHDIGLMQVNKYVWRGFYSVTRLKWDVLYNAGAGMQILAHLLKDVARKRAAAPPARPDELARSVYAAYNGGPAAYRRWRRREPRSIRLIDQSFWSKYQAVSRGQQIDILSCAARWSGTAGH
jgi:Transglycosylase SLT domain